MQLKPLLHYWRNCLADSQHLSVRLDPSSAVKLYPSEIESGALSSEHVEEIFHDAESERMPAKARQDKTLSAEQGRLADVGILIAPFVLKQRVEHGESRRGRSSERVFAPLWISAIVSRSGDLSGDPELAPWIGREYLEPTGRDRFSLGSLDASDEFRGDRQASLGTDWNDHYEYAQALLQAVAGQDDLFEPAFDGVISAEPGAVLKASQVNTARHLLRLYDRLREDPDPGSRLLQAFVTGSRPETIPELDSFPEVAHLGHAQGTYGLQPTQRRALWAVLASKDGETVAINGPPGTGKTTLIQNLVASLWVERAIAGGEPPLIHGCSSNNRAIVNILDTFTRKPDESGDDPFAARWIPEIPGYGLFMASKAKAEEHAGRHPVTTKGYPEWQGFPQEVEKATFLQDAKRHFIAQAHSTFEEIYRSSQREANVAGTRTPESLEEYVTLLHEILVASAGRLKQLTARDDGLRRQSQGQPVDSWLSRLKQEKTTRVSRLDDLETFRLEVEAAIGSVSFWEDLLGFLPGIRVRRNDRLTEPFRRFKLDPPELSSSDYRATLRRWLETQKQALKSELEQTESRIQEAEGYRDDLRKLAASCRQPPYSAEDAFSDPARAQSLFDVTLRLHLFHLAGRYWEGRWLMEMESLLKDPTFARRQGRDDCIRRFRRFAKLTPISVSTFHLLPALFNYFDGAAGEAKPLDGLFDLLIVDEAGQTTPEVGAPALLYARRAVVVGDVHQIEPIWGIDSVLDRANAKRARLHDQFRQAAFEPFKPSGGNLMSLAQRASRWADVDGTPGLMLTEHYRCVPSVISYCNQLVYQGRLVPKRRDPEKPKLPPLGWAHLQHPASKQGGSRINKGQAAAIVDWIERRQPFLEEEFGSLDQALGIVTPFRAQANQLLRELRKKDLTQIEVGTVHAFQGGEKSIMIFSPVYDQSTTGHYFFDRGPNMLNVAVSRAKESFLVFGDMEIFRSDSRQPSGLLARHLFQDQSNEIADVLPVPIPADRAVSRIDTLEGHRERLRLAFESARERLLIVSPYLTPQAVKADDVSSLVRAARSRGVEVVVCYCRDLSKEYLAKPAEKTLSEAGADVWSLDRVHNKTLAKDSDWIVEGSFNWLGAVRDPNNEYQRYEASTVSEQPAAAKMIARVREQLKLRRSQPPD